MTVLGESKRLIRSPEKVASDRPLYASKQTLSYTSLEGLLVTQSGPLASTGLMG